MDNNIGYFKITPYIFEIQILYIHSDNLESLLFASNEQKLNATYYVIIFKVISIKHMVTQMLYPSIFDYKIGAIYEEYKAYYLTYDRAFNENFFDNNEFKLFKHGYTGLYSNYDLNGLLISTFFHNNGRIEGEKLIYNNNGNVKLIYYYKNGKCKGLYNVESDEITLY